MGGVETSLAGKVTVDFTVGDRATVTLHIHRAGAVQFWRVTHAQVSNLGKALGIWIKPAVFGEGLTYLDSAGGIR